MEKVLLTFNILQALYQDGELSKENYTKNVQKLIDRVIEYKHTTKKRLLTLDSLISHLEKEI